MHGALREYVKKDVARLLDVDIKLNAATSSNIKKSFHQNLIFSPVSVFLCTGRLLLLDMPSDHLGHQID